MNEEIAYQNKDITSKYLAENFKGKTFRVYGLDLPGIKDVRPTNIPTVKANELRIDNLFELEDGTVAIVDYESDYEEADKVKYLNYLVGIANRYLADKEKCPVLRMIVIYTGDIRRSTVLSEYDIGALHMVLETAFLSELDATGILERLRDKVKRNELLSDEELMEFIILPLSYRKKEEKERKIGEVVKLATQIQDRGQQLFALAGLLAFTDKIIDHETANRIRRAIEMTQVARIFEEEKQQALTQVARIFEEEKQQALRQAGKEFEEEKQQALRQAGKEFEEQKQQALEQIVVKMLKKGYQPDEIVSLVSGYSEEDVEAVRRKLENPET